jgi:hypothetical protein
MALDYAAVTTFLALKHGDRSGVFLDRIALGRKNWVKSEILTPFLSRTEVHRRIWPTFERIP